MGGQTALQKTKQFETKVIKNEIRDFNFRNRDLVKKISPNEIENLIEKFTTLHQHFYLDKAKRTEWTSGEVLKTIEILQSTDELKQKLIEEELIEVNDLNAKSYISYLDSDDLFDVLIKNNNQNNSEAIVFVLAILYIKYHNRSSSRRA